MHCAYKLLNSGIVISNVEKLGKDPVRMPTSQDSGPSDDTRMSLLQSLALELTHALLQSKLDSLLAINNASTEEIDVKKEDNIGRGSCAVFATETNDIVASPLQGYKLDSPADDTMLLQALTGLAGCQTGLTGSVTGLDEPMKPEPYFFLEGKEDDELGKEECEATDDKATVIQKQVSTGFTGFASSPIEATFPAMEATGGYVVVDDKPERPVDDTVLLQSLTGLTGCQTGLTGSVTGLDEPMKPEPCFYLEGKGDDEPGKEGSADTDDEAAVVQKLVLTGLTGFARPPIKATFPAREATEGYEVVQIEFLNLRVFYEKGQSRIQRQSRQRILDANIRMAVTFYAQIQSVETAVERMPQARLLCGDRCGQVQLDVHMEELQLNKQYFSVDLDSVYYCQDGSTPVYKLSTVDADRRNRFRLVVTVVLIDGQRTRPFYSRPFLLKSRKQIRARSISY